MVMLMLVLEMEEREGVGRGDGWCGLPPAMGSRRSCAAGQVGEVVATSSVGGGEKREIK